MKAVPEVFDEGTGIFEVPSKAARSAECKLLVAILERAILDYVGNEPGEVAAAEAWLFGDEESNDFEGTDTPFSFGWVCDELGLNSTFVRNVLREMPRRGASKVAPWYKSRDYLERVAA